MLIHPLAVLQQHMAVALRVCSLGLGFGDRGLGIDGRGLANITAQSTACLKPEACPDLFFIHHWTPNYYYYYYYYYTHSMASFPGQPE